jgi:hypothetical protein
MSLGQSWGARILWVQYVKSLDSYDAIEPRISSAFAHFSHAASAEVVLDLIGARFCPRD